MVFLPVLGATCTYVGSLHLNCVHLTSRVSTDLKFCKLRHHTPMVWRRLVTSKCDHCVYVDAHLFMIASIFLLEASCRVVAGHAGRRCRVVPEELLYGDQLWLHRYPPSLWWWWWWWWPPEHWRESCCFSLAIQQLTSRRRNVGMHAYFCRIMLTSV